MIHILEYLKVNDIKKDIKVKKHDLIEGELSIDSDIIDKFNFTSRTLRTGNIELVTMDYKTKNDDLLGQRFVFYIKSNPMTLRRQPLMKGWNKEDWDNHPRKMGEFATIEEMCNFFEKFVQKKLIK